MDRNVKVAKELVKLAKTLAGQEKRVASKSDIYVLFEGNAMFVVRKWNTFPQPIFVDELKKEINTFMNDVQQLMGDLAKLLPTEPVLRVAKDRYASESSFEWEWQEQWIYTTAIPLLSTSSINTVCSYCQKNEIRVEK